MSPKREGILDLEYWEDIEEDSKTSTHAGAKKWSLHFKPPSFLSAAGGPRNQLKPTAYLDGLRGFAAFIVYWHHHQLWAHEATSSHHILESAFGYDKQYHFACLPVIRIFFSGGHFAVTVFFVISGYVLAMKPLMLIQAGEHTKLGDNLASALFRRWLRLWIPVICTTFLYMTSWHAFRLWTAAAEQQSNYRDELWKWYAELKGFSFIFRTGGDPWFTYNYHAWSIPVEFKGSIVIYTTLMALSRCKRTARLWCQVGLIVYFLYIADGWFCSLFIAGMLLGDLDLLAGNNDLPRIFSSLDSFRELIFYHLFVISIYLGGIPADKQDLRFLKKSPGWYYLSYLRPSAVFDFKWFYLFWAATFLVASVPRIHWLKSFFETRFNQYLGHISFALYLVHGPVLWLLGDRLYVATGWLRDSHKTGLPGWINTFPVSKAGPLGLELSFLAPHLIILPITLWLAQIVTRLFDEPSVKISRWAYRMTLARPETS